MGTTWLLHAIAPPAGTVAGIVAQFDLVIGQMSQWESESDLSRFNHCVPGEWQTLPAEFAHVLGAAIDISKASAGAFDATIGRVADLWGFGASGRKDGVPEDAKLLGVANGMDGIEFDRIGHRARRSESAVLDFSGIAKGYAVDLASAWLRANSVRHFLLEVGGELHGSGIQPDGQPWWVDIETPPGMALPPSRIALHELSVATSGDYRRWFESGGARYTHTIDPATGRPITNGVRSVTVAHRECMIADAWATALTVLGADEAMRIAQENGLAAYLATDTNEYLSSAWAAMLD